jgi:methylated-DNA-[protein]-cysteine S-methyltransferase
LIKTTLHYSPVFEAYVEADPASLSTACFVTDWLHRFLSQENSPFPLALLDLARMTPFRKEVYAGLCKIPFGQVASYGEVANQIGHERASRAVGTACGRNPFPLLVPCHRVIASDGSLGGFSLDFRIKRALLDFESNNPT